MKSLIVLFLVTAPVLFGIGSCSEEQPDKAINESSKIEEKDMEGAAVIFRQAADKYTYAERGRFTAEIEEALNETTSDLGELSADAEGLSGAALARARRDLKDLRDKVAQLDERNTAAMSTAETRWVADRDRITDTFTDLMRSFDKFRKSLR